MNVSNRKSAKFVLQIKYGSSSGTFQSYIQCTYFSYHCGRKYEQPSATPNTKGEQQRIFNLWDVNM